MASQAHEIWDHIRSIMRSLKDDNRRIDAYRIALSQTTFMGNSRGAVNHFNNLKLVREAIIVSHRHTCDSVATQIRVFFSLFGRLCIHVLLPPPVPHIQCASILFVHMPRCLLRLVSHGEGDPLFFPPEGHLTIPLCLSLVASSHMFPALCIPFCPQLTDFRHEKACRHAVAACPSSASGPCSLRSGECSFHFLGER